MKIGFFTNNYLPRKTGVAHSIANFRKGLQNKGHQVYVFAPEYKESSERKEKNIYRYPSLKVGANFSSLEDTFLRSVPFPFSRRLRKKVRELGLDLIHSHHPFLLGGEGRRLAKKESLPLVFSLHTPYHQYLNNFPAGVKKPLKGVVLRGVIAYIKKSELLVVPTKNAAEPFLKKDIETNLQVVPGGVKVDNFSRPDKLEARNKIYRKYSLNKDTKLLLSVSRLTYEKNISFLLESFRSLREELPQVKLLLVGSGQGEERLKRLARSLDIEDDVIFAGEIPHESLPCFYKGSDLFVFSSLVETQGLVLVEAMAAGLPVVALRCASGSQAVIRDGKTGFLTTEDPQDFAQRCLSLLTKESLYDKFRKAAQKEAQNYSVDFCSKKLLQAYKKVI